MANAWAQDRAGLFYFGFGFYALAAVFVGFSTTYILPLSRGTLEARWMHLSSCTFMAHWL